MTDKTIVSYESNPCYRSPLIEVISVNGQSMLCQSPGNESMPVYDYGDGGFGEV